MTIQATDQFKHAPTISENRWIEAWESGGALTWDNPLWNGCDTLYDTVEQAARALYAYIVGKGHDPNRWLGVGTREHHLGMNKAGVLHRNDTRSLTNARSVRDPALKRSAVVITDPVRRSNYVRYETVFDSVQDGMYRIEDPTYEYVKRGADTLGEVFAIWTEDPGEYTASALGTMNRWADLTGDDMTQPPRAVMLQRLTERYPLKIRIAYIPTSNSNRPNQAANAAGRQWETIHETGNFDPGAGAEMHRRFTHNGGGANPAEDYEGVSFTWVVDDEEVIGLVPPTEKSWQASDGSDGTGNSSESTETCVNSDGDWTKTKENLARHIARRIVADPNRSPDRIAQHNKWARDAKNCPTRLRANGGREWNDVIARIRFILQHVGYFGEATPEPSPSPEPIPDDGNPWYLNLGNRPAQFPFRYGFRGVVEGLARSRYPNDPNSAALALFGEPLSEEYEAVDNRTYQPTTKVVLQFIPGNSAPWDVVILDRDAPLPERKAA